VRLEHFYKTSELRNNPLSVVFTVLERLHVCHQLQRPEVRRALFGYDEPLLSYLYLTCFDRLGQPADWLGFGNWLKSSRHKDEREKAIQQISSTDNIIDAVQLVHSYYTSLYGVKSSFFRFLHEILPSDVHRELASHCGDSHFDQSSSVNGTAGGERCRKGNIFIQEA
jgi:hypothetical protein